MSSPVPIVTGAAVDLGIQTYLRGSGSQPASYASGDTLTAGVYQSRQSSALFTPTVTWYTANSTQTGYTQGQVVVSWTDAQGALLIPTISYTLVVFWAPASSPSKVAPIVRIPLTIEPVPYP
jgi:hypothetical protein